jgi:hypothetical protein
MLLQAHGCSNAESVVLLATEASPSTTRFGMAVRGQLPSLHPFAVRFRTCSVTGNTSELLPSQVQNVGSDTRNHSYHTWCRAMLSLEHCDHQRAGLREHYGWEDEEKDKEPRRY